MMVKELVVLMRQNRSRHGKLWRKLRVDRVGKLFPNSTPLSISQTITSGLDLGYIEQVLKEDDSTGELVPAIKLTQLGKNSFTLGACYYEGKNR